MWTSFVDSVKECRNYVWDVNLLIWSPEEQPSTTGSGGGQPTTSVAANVTGDGSSKVIQAANSARKAWSIFNDSGVTCYLKLGTGASSSSFKVKLVDQSYYILPYPVYTGVIEALWASGAVRVSEET